MTLLERDRESLWHPYTQFKTAGPPLPIVRGEGAFLFAENGQSYLDAVSSWWVNLHGHAHPYIADRVCRQLRCLEHVIFAGFTHPPSVDLAERLLAVLPSGQSRVFYSDNGSTAVEIAIKMAIQYFHNKGMDRRKLVAFDNAFHGETFGAMSAGGDLSLNDPFKGHLFEVLRIPAPVPGREGESLEALRRLINKASIYAFIFEPLVMGAGGMITYEPGPLNELIALCHRHEILCIADEVMTGFGRTGKLFACGYLDEQPDLICLSKGLTGGTLPLAATTSTETVFRSFASEDRKKTFFHGHSYTANPVGCAAALASLDLLETPECRRQLQMIEEQHKAFREKIAGHPAAADVRVRGTILAVEFRTPENTSYFNKLRDELYSFFLDRGILLRPLGNVVYLMPPYCVTAGQLGRIYQAVEAALTHFGKNGASKQGRGGVN